MLKYRALMIGHDGHIAEVNIVGCADDQAAIEVAKHLVDERDVEVWLEGRKVARLEHRAS
jgi:hypothetical protein